MIPKVMHPAESAQQDDIFLLLVSNSPYISVKVCYMLIKCIEK